MNSKLRFYAPLSNEGDFGYRSVFRDCVPRVGALHQTCQLCRHKPCRSGWPEATPLACAGTLPQSSWQQWGEFIAAMVGVYVLFSVPSITLNKDIECGPAPLVSRLPLICVLRLCGFRACKNLLCKRAHPATPFVDAVRTVADGPPMPLPPVCSASVQRLRVKHVASDMPACSVCGMASESCCLFGAGRRR